MRFGLTPSRVAMKGAVTPVETPLSSSTDKANPGARQVQIAHSRTGKMKSLTTLITPVSRASLGRSRANAWKSTPRKLKKSWTMRSCMVQGVTSSPSAGHSTPVARLPRDRVSSIISRICISRFV